MGTTELRAAYSRAGGLPPADDELLEVAGDGSWRLQRTMGGAHVGAFAGRLTASQARALAEAIEAAAGAAAGIEPAEESEARRLPRPDAARESFQAGDRSLDVTAGERVRGRWSALVRLLRRWSGSFAATANAEAALELEVTAAGPLLARRGGGPLVVWPATLRVDLYARDRDGLIVDRVGAGSGEDDQPRGEPLTTAAGWSLQPVLARVVEPPAGGRLEAWVWLDLTRPGGPARVRLVATRPA